MGRLRVMTYNVHGCVGIDGRHAPERIAEVIAEYEPDLVALQEVDVGRERSDRVDQPQQIGRLLGMEHVFSMACEMDGGQYGNAFLSRHPIEVVKAACLPPFERVAGREPRGALLAIIRGKFGAVHVLNTHLGLDRDERGLQADALRGGDWLGDPICQAPVVVCGDLNARPGSPPYTRLRGNLVDVQEAVPELRPRRTWPAVLPIFRLDHVFVSNDLQVEAFEVPSDRLTRVASDHLPVVVDLAERSQAA
jgi:endonuclease/exonuclease/phosphatase family metal-dependent hydrolase